MHDIIVNMFSDKFLDEIFKPQELCSKRALKTIFEKLAHTSIMRLNETSMEKLFDLMIMAVKYQICLSPKPKDILHVTLNHLDAIKGYCSDSQSTLELLNGTNKRIERTYFHMNEGEMQLVRQTLLGSFQDLRIKVSIFLKEKLQNWNGSFIYPNGGVVPPGTPLPGTISFYDETDDKAVSRVSKFNPATAYKPAESEGSLTDERARSNKLGRNIYNTVRSSDTTVQAASYSNESHIQSDMEANVPDPKAIAQLDLLCKLIGSNSKPAKQEGFKLNLFNDDEEEFIYVKSSKSNSGAQSSSASESSNANVIAIDQSHRKRDERLNKIMKDFDDDDIPPNRKSHKKGKNVSDDDEDDLCAMMDKFNR